MSKTGCRDVRDVLFDYLDGTLDNRIASSVEAHLATCQTCRTELEQCRASLALLASAKVEPPADFTARVMARIAAESSEAGKETESSSKVLRPRRILTRRIGTYVAAAALVAVMAVGWRVLPAFMSKSDTATQEHDTLTAAENSSGSIANDTAEETLSGFGISESPESDEGIMMFTVPRSEEAEDATGEAVPKSGILPENDGTAPSSDKMFALAPSADQLIEQYAPDFLGKAQQAALIHTDAPIENRPAATQSVQGDGFAAFLIEDADEIAQAEKLADELGGVRYGDPGTPMVWIEIYG